MKNKHIKKIIFNFFENESSPEEIEQLAKWVKDNPASFKDATELHYLLTKSQEKEKAEHLKSELFAKFDLLIKTNKRKQRLEWLKYAAIFIGVFSISLYFYLSSGRTEETLPKEVTITLGNGQTKETLKENTTGIVSRSSNFVARQEGSKIVYDKVSVENKGDDQQLVYNTLEVPYGKKFEVVLSDGSEVFLNSGSSLTYPVAFFEEGTRNVVLRGEAYFTVKSDSLRPFIVSTGIVETKVLGTQFNVSSYTDDEHIKVVLVEGSLSVGHDDGSEESAPVLLKPNQIASYSDSTKEMVVDNVDVSSHIAWKDGVLLFKNEDFYHITKKLERHYNIEIEIHDDLLKKERYTGRFETETIEEVLQGFQRIKGFDYNLSNKKLILTQKTE